MGPRTMSDSRRGTYRPHAGRTPNMRIPRQIALPFAALYCVACLGSATEPGLEPIGEGRRVLFIGNSYLYSLDIPGMVQALADSAGGDKLAVATVAYPDVALSDHLASGSAIPAIRQGKWEWVVLQQGPSSVLANRAALRESVQSFGVEIAKVGAVPALFSAWPSETRLQDFPAAIESYRLAAEDVNGVFLPVATAWLEAWELEPGADLYADGLHPSAEGAYLSALVIYAKLLGKTPVGLPASLRTRSGVTIALPAATAQALQAAAAAALTATTPTSSR